MTYYSREQWGARPATPGPGNLLPSKVEGVALHWPAMSKPLGSVADVMAALRGWQDFHMDGRGWSDIAYQEAFDQEGNIYELRGLTTQSGANGDQDVNQRFGAFLLVLAPGEQPSAKMMTAVRGRVKAHRARFPLSRRIVGHGEIRPGGTTCPGPITQALISSGEFEPGVVRPEPLGRNLRGALRDLRRARAYWRKRKDRPAGVRRVQRAIDWVNRMRGL